VEVGEQVEREFSDLPVLILSIYPDEPAAVIRKSARDGKYLSDPGY